MSDLTPEIVDSVIAACQAGAGEAAEALSRALDAEVAVEVGEAGIIDPAAPPEGFDGPGLAVLMTFAGVGAVAALPSATGLLPDWVQAPDATGESKLSTLAQELSMLLVPETLMADEFQAAWVDNLAAALERGGVGGGPALVPLALKAGDMSGQMSLVWPATKPSELFANQEEAKSGSPEAPAESSTAESPEAASLAPPPPPRITDLSQLPSYSRSLLKVMVPVTVELAVKKQTVQEIIELGPGSIIMFEKSCDDPVHLTVGGERVALGEVVKVGEKFGMRIDEMVLPEEKFKPLRRPAG